MTHNPKIIAFHLPQFHRIPENDAWWGEGFTEWTNVRKARPLYRKHYQPRVPKDGRYYDMLDPKVREWQADLARAHGIHGFCYYHYWFNGKRLLERPVEEIVSLGQPDFPFCLAWANEPWTRVWDGGEKHVLMPQSYGDTEDWQRHIQYLLKIFKDPRYIRVNDKPVFLIYRSGSIRNLPDMLEHWRTEAERAGLRGLHVVSMANGFPYDARIHLFDAYAEFEPMWTIQKMPRWQEKLEHRERKRAKFWRRYFGRIIHPDYSFDYPWVWTSMAARDLPPNHYPGGFADWDNTPRRGLDHSMAMRRFDRHTFEIGMAKQIAKARSSGAEFLFFNAWNEWAEGTYLEPDEGRGSFFLEAIKRALES